MTKETEEYYGMLDNWMKYFGMEPLDTDPNWLFDKAYRRSRLEAAKFGQSNTYAFVKFAENPDVQSFEQFSRESFNYAMTFPKAMPVGFGATVTVYPCYIVNRITKELADFVKNYLNKHYAAFEFPGILDMFSKEVYYYPSTPIWGALYYNGFRSEFYRMFSVKAWSDIAKTSV